MPESPRWLLVHGRKEEAKKTMIWIAKVNGRKDNESQIEHFVETFKVRINIF